MCYKLLVWLIAKISTHFKVQFENLRLVPGSFSILIKWQFQVIWMLVHCFYYFNCLRACLQKSKEPKSNHNLTIWYYHVTYVFQSESALLSVKELLAQNRHGDNNVTATATGFEPTKILFTNFVVVGSNPVDVTYHNF